MFHHLLPLILISIMEFTVYKKTFPLVNKILEVKSQQTPLATAKIVVSKTFISGLNIWIKFAEDLKSHKHIFNQTILEIFYTTLFSCFMKYHENLASYFYFSAVGVKFSFCTALKAIKALLTQFHRATCNQRWSEQKCWLFLYKLQKIPRFSRRRIFHRSIAYKKYSQKKKGK